MKQILIVITFALSSLLGKAQTQHHLKGTQLLYDFDENYPGTKKEQFRDAIQHKLYYYEDDSVIYHIIVFDDSSDIAQLEFYAIEGDSIRTFEKYAPGEIRSIVVSGIAPVIDAMQLLKSRDCLQFGYWYTLKSENESRRYGHEFHLFDSYGNTSRR